PSARIRREIPPPGLGQGAFVEAATVADLTRLRQDQEQPNQRPRRTITANDPALSPGTECSPSTSSAVAPPAVQSGRRYQAAQDRAPDGANLQPDANGRPASGAARLLDARARAARRSMWHAPRRDSRAPLGLP